MSIIEDFHAFLTSLIQGDGIEVIFPGAFFLLALIVAIAVWIVIGKIKSFNNVKITLAAVSCSLYLYYFSLKHFPLELIKSDIPITKRDGMLFGQFWYPFYQFESFLDVVSVYANDFIFLLVFGFLVTITFKSFKKLCRFLILDVSVVAFEMIFVLANNLCHSGLCDSYDLSLVIIEIPAMLLGYLLALIVISLNKSIYERLHKSKQSGTLENII